MVHPIRCSVCKCFLKQWIDGPDGKHYLSIEPCPQCLRRAHNAGTVKDFIVWFDVNKTDIAGALWSIYEKRYPQ